MRSGFELCANCILLVSVRQVFRAESISPVFTVRIPPLVALVRMDGFMFIRRTTLTRHWGLI